MIEFYMNEWNYDIEKVCKNGEEQSESLREELAARSRVLSVSWPGCCHQLSRLKLAGGARQSISWHQQTGTQTGQLYHRIDTALSERISLISALPPKQKS